MQTNTVTTIINPANIMRQKLFFILLPLLFFQQSFSQKKQVKKANGETLQTAAIDRNIQRLCEAAGVTGISIGIINDDQPAFVKSYGFKNKSLKQPNSVHTSFYAASFSKSVFAYLVMQLVDQQKIDLDKPLYEYLPKPLPEYADYKDLAGDERWKLITARHCLSHTTGFPNWRFLNPNGSGKLEIFFTPGTRYAYSGEGIFLLQLAVEVITGNKLEELAQEKIFKPFQMTHTSFVWQPMFDNDYATGHSFDEDTFSVRKRTGANAAGSMQTTIIDFTGFVSFVLQGKGLSGQSKKEMLSPQIGIFTKRQFPSLNNDTTDQNKTIELSYGLGWGLFKTAYGQAFFKEGHSDDGWVHYAIAIPDKKMAFIMMSNSMNGESIFKELTAFVTGIVIPWEWEGYIPYKPAMKPAMKILKQYEGEYAGPANARVFIENGELKIEAPSAGLSKSTLYATDETRFFLKAVPLNLEFIKGTKGTADKIKVNEEGEHYELNRIIPDAAGIELSKEQLTAYMGKYKLKDNNRTVFIEKKNNKLVINIPGQEIMELIFHSSTIFKVKSVLDIHGEFILENGKVAKLVIEQKGRFEWDKINE